METVEYKNISFTVWDVGGQDKVGSCMLDFHIDFLFLYVTFFLSYMFIVMQLVTILESVCNHIG